MASSSVHSSIVLKFNWDVPWFCTGMTISDAIIEITRLQVCAVVNFRSEDKLQTIQTYNSFKNNTIISFKYLLLKFSFATRHSNQVDCRTFTFPTSSLKSF